MSKYSTKKKTTTTTNRSSDLIFFFHMLPEILASQKKAHIFLTIHGKFHNWSVPQLDIGNCIDKIALCVTSLTFSIRILDYTFEVMTLQLQQKL